MKHLRLSLTLISCLLAGCAHAPLPCPPADPPAAPPPLSPEEGATAEASEAEEADLPTVMLDGVPEIPQALRDRLQQYSNVRSASLESINEDASEILITTRFAETAQVHRVEAPGGARHQLTFADEPIRGVSFVPGAPTSLLYMSDIGGTEDHQIFRLDQESGETTLLTDGESKHSSYVLSHDGSALAYNSNGRNDRDMDIYLADGRSPQSARRLLEVDGYWYPIEFSRDGRRLLVGEYVSINDSRVYVVDVESGALTRLTPEDQLAAYLDAAFGASSDQVFIASDRDGEFRELYEVDAGDPAAPWRRLTQDIPWNIENIAVSANGRTLAFTTNEGGFSALRLMDTRRGRMRLVESVPRGIIRGLEFARRSDTLAFSLMTATRPSDAYTLALRGERLTRWTESEIGGLNPDRFVEPELISFTSFDQREIPAFYYRPRGEGPFPVVVYIHGGPESQARPRFSSLIQYLVVERNIAVLYPNVRGSDGYGKSYLLLDNGLRREDSVRDIGALLDWTAEQEELDEGRVGVLGGSYGGYMVLASLTHFGERIRAGVDIVGISNFVTFLENTREYRRDLRRAEYGDERDPEMRAHLERISPANQADRIRSALFVAHGANDPRVPASEAEQIVEAVRSGGQDVWYMLARNEGHGFRKKENRDTYFALTVLFFEQFLTGAP